MHTVTLELPDSVSVTLRGHNRAVDVTKLPAGVLATILTDTGIQRKLNDPLGNLFPKGTTPPDTEIDKYLSETLARWEKGEIAKARGGGVGRTTDPVQREIKRLANAEIDAAISDKDLLAFHGNVSRKVFDTDFRPKYLASRIAKEGPHYERLEKEAKANLAKAKKTVGAGEKIAGESADGQLAEF